MADWSAIKTSRSGLAGFNKGTNSKVCSFKVHLFNWIYKSELEVKPRVYFMKIWNHRNRSQIFIDYSTHVTMGYNGAHTICG